MPAIAPFRALGYAPHLSTELDRLVAPPYDVQSEEQRARLAARHDNNIVHVDLPRPPAGEDPYQVAGRRITSWVRDGILTRDAEPAFYVCEQRYRRPTGGEATRRGFFARLTLEPLGAGSIIPHERTLDGPRSDRIRLLSATRVHLSPIFLLHPDPEGEAARLVTAAMDGEPARQARDDDGTISRIVRVYDRERTGFLTDRLRKEWALIADGHHRYESALAYRDERRGLGRRDAEHVLAFFCSLQDPGLAIYPIHRLVHSLPGFDPGRFLESMAPLFRLTRKTTPEDLSRELASMASRPGVLGVALPDSTFWLAEWKEGEGLTRPEMAETPEPLRRLDVILLHRLVLEGLLGVSPEAQARQLNLDYVKEARQVYERVAAGKSQVGFQMNPTRMEQVVEVTRAGFRLPQKSTYFFPKLLTGLVLDPLD
jgi:uncharacterized protein (DUF1015 family)